MSLPFFLEVSWGKIRICFGWPTLSAFCALRVGFSNTLFLRCVRRRQSGLFAQQSRLIGRFPGKVLVAASEVPICRGLPVNRSPQVQRLDDPLRCQLE